MPPLHYLLYNGLFSINVENPVEKVENAVEKLALFHIAGGKLGGKGEEVFLFVDFTPLQKAKISKTAFSPVCTTKTH